MGYILPIDEGARVIADNFLKIPRKAGVLRKTSDNTQKNSKSTSEWSFTKKAIKKIFGTNP